MAHNLDKKTIGYGVLCIVQGLLVGAIPVLVSSRLPHVDWVLGALAIMTLVAGPALVFGGRFGRVLTGVVCLLHWLVGLVVAVLILSSASYLYGIYGHHGHSVGALGFVFTVVALVLFWLIPGHLLGYVRRERAAR
jgi:cation transport ATPase